MSLPCPVPRGELIGATKGQGDTHCNGWEGTVALPNYVEKD
jgi:hypothetical protein